MAQKRSQKQSKKKQKSKKRAAKEAATPTRHRLRVTLAGIEPPIWREIEVPSTISLTAFHGVIQTAFGWERCHLWEFEIDGVTYGDLDLVDDPGPDLKDAYKRRLGVVAPSAGAALEYRYDFGDDWLHVVEVVAVVPARGDEPPACLDGKRAGPPEDCGGVYGYQELVEALRDPEDERHEEMKRWAGEDFDAEAFDIEAVNDALQGRVREATVEPFAFGFDSADEPTRKALEALIDAGEELPEEIRSEVLQLGDRAIAPLIEILEAPELADVDAPGEGWAPVHAARLLGKFRAAAAIEPMLDVLEATHWDDVLHDAILVALPEIGPPILEPALRAVMASDEQELRFSLLGALARLKHRDPRIFELLVEAFAEDPDFIAADLADYGDPAALPMLVEAFDRIEVVEQRLANQVLIEIADAIETLAGQLTESQAAKLERVRELRMRPPDRPAPEARAKAKPKLGRNDPCHCGSGKKYKKCHLDADHAPTLVH